MFLGVLFWMFIMGVLIIVEISVLIGILMGVLMNIIGGFLLREVMFQ